jgi:hypothetical protein
MEWSDRYRTVSLLGVGIGPPDRFDRLGQGRQRPRWPELYKAAMTMLVSGRVL